jgi:hypothetical protein
MKVSLRLKVYLNEDWTTRRSPPYLSRISFSLSLSLSLSRNEVTRMHGRVWEFEGNRGDLNRREFERDKAE